MLLESNWIVYGLLASIIASVHLWMGWFEARFVRSENRWIGFALLVVFGYLLGVVTELPESTIVVATAFTAGIILVNVMSEELPRGKEGRSRYFLVGVGVFAVASLLIPRT